MLKKELIKRSPIRVLENSIHGGVGKGNLGVFTGRKGLGKTACLVHLAIDNLLRDKKVLHITFSKNPHHMEEWYEQVFREIAKAFKLENVFDTHDQIIHNRLILHYKQQNKKISELTESILNFTKNVTFSPDIIIIDGFSFEDASEDQFKIWKSFASQIKIPIWFSATLHREDIKYDAAGIPAPVNKFNDIFSVIIMLQPRKNYIALSLLKDHETTELEKMHLKLDLKTLLISNHRV